MDLMMVLQLAALVAVGAIAPLVVRSREPINQAIVLSFYGLMLTMMFFLFQAPDVALSQVAIGAVALPLMILLALAKVRRQEERTGQEREP